MKQSRLFNHLILSALILSHGWRSRVHPMAGVTLLARLPDMVQAAQTLSMAMATAIACYHQRSHVARALYEQSIATASCASGGIRHEQIPLFPSLKTVESYQSSFPSVMPISLKDNAVVSSEILVPSATSCVSASPESSVAGSRQVMQTTAHPPLFRPESIKITFSDFQPRFQPEPTGVQCYWQARLVTPQPLSELQESVDRMLHESAVNRYWYGAYPPYRMDVDRRMGEFFELLGSTNSPDLIVRIKSRLLLAYCDLEYPWGDFLIGSIYGLMKEYFHKDGSLGTTLANDNALEHFHYFVDNVAPENKKPFLKEHYKLAVENNNGTKRSFGADLWWKFKKKFSFPSYWAMRQRIAEHEENRTIVTFIECCEKNSVQDVLQRYYTLGPTRPIIQEIFQYYFGHSYDTDGLLRTSDPYYTALTPQDRTALNNDRAQRASFNYMLHLRAVCVKTMQQRWNLTEEQIPILYNLLDDQGALLYDTNVLLKRVEQLCAQDATLLPLFYLPNGVLKDLQPLTRAQTLPSCSALMQDYSLAPLRILLNKAVIAEYEQHNEAAIHFLDTISLSPHTVLAQLHHACARGDIERPLPDFIPPSNVIPQLDPPPMGDDLIGIVIPPIPQPPDIPELPKPQCGTGSGNPEPKISETCPTASRYKKSPPNEQQYDSKIVQKEPNPDPFFLSVNSENPKNSTSKSYHLLQQNDVNEPQKSLPQPPCKPLIVNEEDLTPTEKQIYERLKEIKRQYSDIITHCPPEEIVKEIKALIRELYEEYIKNYDPVQRLSLKKIAQLLKVEEKDLYRFHPYVVGFEHIFNIDYWKNAKGEAQIGGWHLDHKNILVGSGIIEVEIIKELPNRCKKVRIKWLGDSKESTLVPPDWSSEKYIATLEKIVKDTALKARFNWNNTQVIVHGYSEDLIPFKIVFTDQGKLKTAYPDFDWENNANNNSP